MLGPVLESSGHQRKVKILRYLSISRPSASWLRWDVDENLVVYNAGGSESE